MQIDEKERLRDKFDESKYHLVTAMNILMFLQRIDVIQMDSLPPNQGKKYQWNMLKLDKMIDTIIP